ncbi:MAG: hypothetical protein ACTS73_04205 [Arsenophonus sp. NEOnobi-MAG3]
MICHEKSTLQVSVKLNITCDLLHKLIPNAAKKPIANAVEADSKPCAATTC